MVGVAGKSKGCLTCRKRKIQCDLKRPACDQCQRTRRVCEGYAKPTIFINKFPRDPDVHSRGISEFARSSAGCPQVVSSSHSSSQLFTLELRDRVSAVIPTSLTAKLSLHNVLLREFVTSTLPEGVSKEPPLSWITFIIDSLNCTEALSLAGSAIAYGWAGHVEAQLDLVNQGRRYYM